MPHYYQAVNTGHGFITHADNELAHISGYPGDIWVTENTTWAERIGALELTKEEAQAIVDTVVSASIGTYNPITGIYTPPPVILP